MASIKSMDMNNGGINITLSISKEEYKVLKHHMSDIVVLPAGKDSLVNELTTGKLGNSNRVMLPKKMLESFHVHELDKKVPSNVFILNDDAYILMKIRRSRLGIPRFREGLE